jgi:ribonuclease P protein component
MADARLPRQARLRDKVDFQRVFARSEKSVDHCFTVLYRCNRQPLARLGLAVSRRTSKRAVVRNRIKRLIRESFRQHRQQLRGFDVVIISRSTAATCDNATLFASLIRHLEKLKTASCAPCCSA